MADKSKDLSSQAAAAPSAAAVASAAPPAAAQPAAALPSPSPTPAPALPPLSGEAARAVDEFARIALALSTTALAQDRTPLRPLRCPAPAKWCLPPVNCKARLNLPDAARAAFEQNRENCNPIILERSGGSHV